MSLRNLLQCISSKEIEIFVRKMCMYIYIYIYLCVCVCVFVCVCP